MRFVACLSLSLFLSPSLGSAENPVSFTRDVKPLLSNKCFACHGPDDDHREADLRLDTFAGSTTDIGGYAAVVVGKPEDSEIIARIVESDPDIRMPPPKFGDALTAEEVSILKRWIAEGAQYEQHWAYAPIAFLSENTTDVLNADHAAIDRFVAERLENTKLEASPQADPYLLARRVALDLTGLPPTLEQADAYAANPTDEAYARLVNELMASPQYGEHWASMWLDIARYADSAGYADDPLRTIWSYRDYVIRAFNENRPFDQFTIEQLAGDMLPEPTQEQLIATAFHRNTLTNNEGGTDDEEFRNVAVVDRVNTTASVWLGTTFACCQCHNHKYDPISQAEYFQLFAIFNQTADTDKRDERPFHSVFTSAQLERADKLEAEIAALDTTVQAHEAGLNDRMKVWEDTAATSQQPITGRYVRVDIPGKSAFLSLAEVEVFVGETNVAPSGKASQSSNSSGGFAPKANDGNTGGKFHDDSSTTHTTFESHPWWEVDLKADQPIDAITVWNRTDDGVGDRLKGFRVQILDAQRKVVWQRLGNTIPDPSERFDVSRLPSEIESILAVAANDRTDEQSAALRKFYRQTDVALFPLLAERFRLVEALREARVPETVVPIMQELPEDKRRRTNIHIRGDFRSVGEEVQPGTPGYLPPLPEGVEPNRMALAEWLIAEENPLTPRVLANRIWSRLFGRGLVRTVEDFGSQGDLPTHPELLDWLAARLVVTDWDMKGFIRTIVMSKTYRQSAEVTDEQRKLDAANEWLARGPRFRITAEMVRDQALAVSGLLSEKMYGPPVHPPQPKTGLKAAFGTTLEWKNDVGEDRYRRALYTEIRRSLPFPDMQIMDAPNREVCINERSRTNTPLQAFLTLNGEVYVEAAQAMARRVLKAEDCSNDDDRITRAFRLALVRPPSQLEHQRLRQLLADSRAFYKVNPEEAVPAATIPLGPVEKNLDVVEAAAWTATCSVIMNLDEVFLRP